MAKTRKDTGGAAAGMRGRARPPKLAAALGGALAAALLGIGAGAWLGLSPDALKTPKGPHLVLEPGATVPRDLIADGRAPSRAPIAAATPASAPLPTHEGAVSRATT